MRCVILWLMSMKHPSILMQHCPKFNKLYDLGSWPMTHVIPSLYGLNSWPLIISHHILGLWPIYFPQGIKAYATINLCYIFIMGTPTGPQAPIYTKMGVKEKNVQTISQYLFGLVDHMIMKSTILGYWTAWSVDIM